MMACSIKKEEVYDLVIIYPEELLRWVKLFESHACEHWNMTNIFLYDRDNRAGRNISDEWVRAIDCTQKVLLFASKGMDTDEWAQFATYFTQNFSPSGQKSKLAIVKFSNCRILRNFQIYNIIDCETEAGKMYFWPKLYEFCTGIKVRRKQIVPGLDDEGYLPEDYMERLLNPENTSSDEDNDETEKGDEEDCVDGDAATEADRAINAEATTEADRAINADATTEADRAINADATTEADRAINADATTEANFNVEATTEADLNAEATTEANLNAEATTEADKAINAGATTEDDINADATTEANIIADATTEANINADATTEADRADDTAEHSTTPKSNTTLPASEAPVQQVDFLHGILTWDSVVPLVIAVIMFYFLFL